MKLAYETTQHDAVETGVRRFIRSKTYTTNRWRGAAVCGAMFAFFAMLGFNAKENIHLGLVCAAAGAWGAGLFLLAYKGAVRRRIQNYMTTDATGTWPRASECKIEAGQLICAMGGARQNFPLSDLRAVREDERFVEFDFGAKGLCVIPQRAFPSAEKKAAFRAAAGC